MFVVQWLPVSLLREILVLLLASRVLLLRFAKIKKRKREKQEKDVHPGNTFSSSSSSS